MVLIDELDCEYAMSNRNASNRVCKCGERPSSRGPRRTVQDPRTCVDDNVHGRDNCCKFRSSLDSAHETQQHFFSKISHLIYVFELYLHVETPSISCTRNCVHPGFGFHTGTAMSGDAQPKRASRALRVYLFTKVSSRKPDGLFFFFF